MLCIEMLRIPHFLRKMYLSLKRMYETGKNHKVFGEKFELENFLIARILFVA